MGVGGGGGWGDPASTPLGRKRMKFQNVITARIDNCVREGL